MHVDVSVRGAVPADVVRMAADEVSALERFVKGPVMGARVVLIQERNPRIERPARAEGEVVLAGRPIRARVDAPAMRAAVDALVEHLREQLRRHVDRLITRERVPATTAAGEWRHAAWTPPRPPRSWRRPGERRIVRRKPLDLEPIGVEQAAVDLAALDHDFFLYHDADTDTDALLYRRDDDRLAVLQPQDAPASPHDAPPREPSRYSERLTLSAALSEMDALDHRFLYFTNAEMGRACVLYLRFDGHYGLIEPAPAAVT